MERIELSHMERFMVGQARDVLADVKGVDFGDARAIAGLLGKAKVSLENLLDILGDAERGEDR